MITDNPVCLIQRGKPKSQILAQAVLDGVGRGRILYGDRLCKASYQLHDWYQTHETPVIIGAHETTYLALHYLTQRQHPFVVLDNGYFKPYREGGYFRATTNAMQWIGGPDGREHCDPELALDRFAALGITPKPWREKTGTGHILIVLQSEGWYRCMGYDRAAWLKQTMAEIRKHSRRRVIVREKPRYSKIPIPELAEHFFNCHAVVAFSSNVLVQAAFEGIPVFPLMPCAATPLGTHILSDIENPVRPERHHFFNDLAANQWLHSEIESGQMWRDLKDRYQSEFYELA